MKVGKLHHRTLDLTGRKFGWLTGLAPGHSNGAKRYWHFQCRCGKQVVKIGTEVKKEVKRGGTPNCGCLTKHLISKGNTTHGMSKHPAFAVWRSMNDRCRLPTHQAWANYGGRGIKVCKRWQKSFENFWSDLGPTYKLGLDLNRKNNNGNYTPTNCEWTTRRKNSMNKRNTERRVDVMALSKKTGIAHTTIYYRLAHGWPLSELAREPDTRNRCMT